MSDSDLSNQARLNQNIRISSLESFREYIGGINGSPALMYDNYTAVGLSNDPDLARPLDGNEILSAILQSSAEGAYFTRDIINNFLTTNSAEEISTANSTTNKVLNSLIPGKESEKAFKIYPVGGKISTKKQLWAYKDVKIEDALKDVDVSYKKITKKIDDGTGTGNQIEVEGYGTSKPGEDFIPVMPHVNASDKLDKIPDRIDNPTITAFTIRKGRFSLNSRNQDELSLFFNAIPTLEMSKCAPYLSLLIRYPRDKNTEDNMSLGSFLRYVVDDPSNKGTLILDEGIGLRKAKSKLNVLDSDDFVRSGVSAFGNFEISEKVSVTSEAGMELFLSPQTLSNSNVKNSIHGQDILEPIMPLMSLKSFDVSIQGLGYGLYASKTATMTLTLHDRSRLKDVKPLVSPEQFGEVRLLIEYGWSHPEGDLRHNNPIGQFLNTLRDVGIFTVSSSTFNFTGTAVDITLNLAMMGGDDSNAVLSACGKVIQGKIFKPQIEAIMASIIDETTQLGYDQEKLKEIRKKHIINMNQASSFNSVIDMSSYHELLKLSGYYDGSSGNKKEFIKKAKVIFGLGDDAPSNQSGGKKTDEKKFKATENGKRLIEAMGEKIQSLSYITDPFIPEMREAQFQNTNLQGFIDANSTKEQIEFAHDGIFGSTSSGRGYAGGGKAVVSLGALMTKFVAEPLTTTLRYDEVQLYFYPVNHRSGGARIYNTATLPIILADFKEKINEKLFKNPTMAVSKFISFVDSAFLNDGENAVYGISHELNIKKTLQSFNTDALKKMSDIDLQDLGFGAEFVSMRDKLNSEKGNNTLTEAEQKKLKDKRSELLQEANSSISSRLALIYSQDGSNRYIGELKFQTVDLGVMYETLPAIKPSKTNDDANLYYNKTILKIHVYDKNYTPDPDLLHMQELITSDVINPGHGLTDNSESADTPNELVASLSTRQVKEMIKRRKSSFTYGAEYTNVETFSIQSVGTGGSSIGNALFLTALNDKDSPQLGHGGAGSNDDMLIIPSKASVKCLGMPFLVRGQELYVDMNSGTTADNLYRITDVKHSFSQNFTTTFSLTYVGANSIKDIRKKMIHAVDQIDSTLAKSEQSDQKAAAAEKAPANSKEEKKKKRTFSFLNRKT